MSRITDRFSLSRRALIGAGVGAGGLLALSPTGLAAQLSGRLAFPGAQGWAARTPGGAGGRIIKVTSLKPYGPGSLGEAVTTPGPRIVVFEVGGVIDLKRSIMVIKEPFLTIAGQTAPEPGITIIGGGLDVRTHDAIIRHIRVRPGSAGQPKMSGWECDGINVEQSARVIIDHCSTSWGTDENLSVSGPPFNGRTPAEWRQNTSHEITLSNNLIAEGLRNSTHSKGEHSKGTLVNYNVSNVLIVGNLYASNRQRNPLFGAGASGAVVNNYIVDPGSQAIFLSAIDQEWHGNPYETGRLAVIANVLEPGPATAPDLALLRAVTSSAPWLVYLEGNLARRLGGGEAPLTDIQGSAVRFVDIPPLDIPDLSPIPAEQVASRVLANVGARPWARDAIDRRIIADAAGRGGRMIDDQDDVGGYPHDAPTQRAFDPGRFDRDTMDPLD